MTKLAILASSGHSGKFCQEGRLGPPESVEKPEKHGKARKGLFSGFLRGTRALAEGVILWAIVQNDHIA